MSIITPFNAFIENAVSDSSPVANINDKFVAGFQLGYSSSNLNNPGATSSGLYAILNGVWLSQIYNPRLYDDSVFPLITQFNFNENFYPVVDPQSNSLLWVLRNPQTLINTLNRLHQNINGWMAVIDPTNEELLQATVDGDVSPDFYALYTSIFNKFNTVNFINSYTGYGNARKGDMRGNGIAHLFVLTDQNDFEKWQLSRAGVELQCLIDYLCYGGVAVIGPTWKSLNNYHTTAYEIPSKIRAFMAAQYGQEVNSLGTRLFTPPLDVIVTLEQGGLIERRSSVAGYGSTGTNRAAYASQPFTYPNVGVSYGIAYGLTSSELINNHNPPEEKGSFLTAFFGSNNYTGIPIIHAGLSGTDISISQEPIPDSSIFKRYPGLDGLTGQRPENNSPSAGLTTYRFADVDENSELNRFLCVVGKNTKVMSSSIFGNPASKTLNISIPAVGDVAGILARNKMYGEGIYIPPAGPDRAALLNGTILPTFPFNRKNPDAVSLYTNRIVFFDNDQGLQGGDIPFMTHDFTGATSSTIDQDRDRLSVNWMVRGMGSVITTYLNTKIGQQSNPALWNQVKADIEGIILKNFNIYLNSPNGYTVKCDEENDNAINSTTLYVDVTIVPKPTIVTYSGPTSQALQGYVLRFEINTAPPTG